MEILVAVSAGAILVVGAASVIVPALLVNRQATPRTTATTVGTELLNNVRVWSEGDWHGILGIATGSTNLYYLNTSSSPFTAVGASSTGGQSVMVGTSTYIRYFYVTDVYRTSGNIVTVGGTYDPSTKLVTVVSGQASSTTSSYVMYLTRHAENIYDQSDWAAGATTTAAPVTAPDNAFSTSSNISYSTTTGSIYIKLLGY